ncbi:MAG: Potassium efflux system KefA protein / Small-conductance mechanosensitive channel [Labilithrix sp.]|nr:Potassium efflux system KefA protein / Small-conductance mechanosensitive channel [Labilithrix sp.]
MGAVGIVAAAVLLGVARLLLPKADRDRSRIAAIYLVLAVVFGAAEWLSPTGSSVERTIDFFFWFFVLASCGRSLVLLAVDVVFGKKTHRSAPRIFRDLTQAVVYVIVLMLTLRAIGVEPGSLLTTSALLTAVVGLALQDTLGNLVSGLALQMQRPFEVGDWIQFDSDARQIGQVTEVNWRATTVMTSDLVEVIVPNAMLARAPIRNYSRPSKLSRRTVTVQGPYEASPHRVHEAITKAVLGTPGVLAEPAPWVQTRTFADSGVEYMVYFFIDDYAARERIDGLVRDRVWYGMQRGKLTIPFPMRTVHMHEISEESRRRDHEKELERRDKILRCVDFLDVLPSEMHRALAAAAEVRFFAQGEVVVRQGDRSAEMFIIDKGDVAVELHRETRAMSVARLGPGKFFGEMGLMTGEVRAATVRALGECELLVVGHDAFHATIAAAPGVIEKMSELLALRQAELEALASERRPSIEPMQDRSKRLISQIKSFFKL